MCEAVTVSWTIDIDPSDKAEIEKLMKDYSLTNGGVIKKLLRHWKECRTEAVEVCPHCMEENVFPGWDVNKEGFEAKCEHCGEEIMLCDECTHAEDNPHRVCDWRQYVGGDSTCWRKTQHQAEKICDKNSAKIKIKYCSEELEKLQYINGKSDWIDLRAAERVEMKKGEFRLIDLGIAMEIPKGYEAHIIPRSSAFDKFGILQTNCMGLIDESYCGDNDRWFFPALAIRDTVIEVNDRICQFRLMEHQPKINFVEVETLGNPDRGGHGSTGAR